MTNVWPFQRRRPISWGIKKRLFPVKKKNSSLPGAEYVASSCCVATGRSAAFLLVLAWSTVAMPQAISLELQFRIGGKYVSILHK